MTARQGAGLPGHRFVRGDVVRLKDDDSGYIWVIVDLLTNDIGVGYRVIPLGGGGQRAVRDENVIERVEGVSK